jgi:hypothetical protein
MTIFASRSLPAGLPACLLAGVLVLFAGAAAAHDPVPDEPRPARAGNVSECPSAAELRRPLRMHPSAPRRASATRAEGDPARHPTPPLVTGVGAPSASPSAQVASVAASGDISPAGGLPASDPPRSEPCEPAALLPRTGIDFWETEPRAGLMPTSALRRSDFAGYLDLAIREPCGLPPAVPAEP